MLETIIAIVITVAAAIVTGIICWLSAHKEEIWDVISDRHFNK